MNSANAKVVIGVDIAKDTFDIAALAYPEDKRLRTGSLPNTPAGHRRLVRHVQDFAGRYGPVHVVMEATGTYHLRLCQALLDAAPESAASQGAGLCVSVVNPLQIKRFGQMKLRRLKTDRADAALIAAYGREQCPPPYEMPSRARQQLKQITTLMAQLTKQRTALLNLRHAQEKLPESAPRCQQVLARQIEELTAALGELEAERDRLIESEFAAERALMNSVKGVGPKTSAALVAYVGDLRDFEDYRQLLAFMGLNPVPNQSGRQERAARISKQGHAVLRTLFYMGAGSALQHNRSCRALYERLIARGKLKKVARVAVACKLVKQVFAVVKKGVPYDDNYAQQSALAA